MRLCRFNNNRLGLVRGDEVADVTAALEALPAHRYPLPRHDPLIAHLGELRAGIAAAAQSAKPRPVDTLELLSPIANPGKIVAAPVNYKKHLEEARADTAIHHQKQVEENCGALNFGPLTADQMRQIDSILERQPIN